VSLYHFIARVVCDIFANEIVFVVKRFHLPVGLSQRSLISSVDLRR